MITIPEELIKIEDLYSVVDLKEEYAPILSLHENSECEKPIAKVRIRVGEGL